MLEFFRSWLSSVVTASVIVSVALAVTPPGNVKKTVQLASGLVMAVVLLTPFVRGVPEFDWSLPDISEVYDQNDQMLMKEIIAEKTAAYIVNKAQAVGLSVSAEVICEEGDMYPMPVFAEIRSDSPEEAERLLGPVITAELGIETEKQKYTTETAKGGG